MSVITSIEITKQPDHGHVSVNPNRTLAFIGTGSEYVGPVAFEYRVNFADGTSEDRRQEYPVEPSPQQDGWGTGENFYMLPVDASDRVIVEHGDNHRKVYASEAGLTAADIAAGEGVAESDVTGAWLEARPEYGGTEAMALHTVVAMKLWQEITYWKNRPFSHWLLLERGHEYGIGTESNIGPLFQEHASGESPFQPLFIGAWGTGARPKVMFKEKISKRPSSNIVVQEVDFDDGFGCNAPVSNLLLDNVTLGYDLGFQGLAGLEDPNTGITVRNALLKDIWRDAPAGDTSQGIWWPYDNRQAGLFVRGTVGLLLEGLIFDRIGWAPDFAPDGSLEGGQPPNFYSHNVYLQDSTRDVTMRESITMRAASIGAQFRGGAFVQDVFVLDNNIAFNVLGGDYQDNGPVGNYSLVDGTVTTVSARRGGGVSKHGALDWGIDNVGLLTSMVGNIVAHANDPDDPEDTYLSEKALDHAKGDAGVFVDDTIIWRWGIGTNAPHLDGPSGGSTANVEGLDPEVMNTTTIQRYTADLLGQETATTDDFGSYLATLDSAEYAGATQDVLAYFRAGFGMPNAERRASAETLRFIPDPRGDGVRWDNRINWSTGDLPGTVAGDSVDLGGNRVVFGGTVDINNLSFGKFGKLIANHGRLRVYGEVEKGFASEISIGQIGQVWFAGTGALPDVKIEIGRFAAISDVTVSETMTISLPWAQAILATAGTTCTVTGSITKDALGKIGFDSDQSGVATLVMEDTATLDLKVSRTSRFLPIGKFRSGAFDGNADLSVNITLGGALIVDMAGHTGEAETLPLIEADSITGAFASVEVINKPDGTSATIEQDGGALNLVIA